MKLQCEEKTYFVVDAYEFDRFIQEAYGRSEYNFGADLEIDPEETCVTFTVTGEVLEYRESAITLFIEKGEYFMSARYLLDDLCRRGLIEEGNYLVGG